MTARSGTRRSTDSATSAAGWRTRIASFALPSCIPAPPPPPPAPLHQAGLFTGGLLTDSGLPLSSGLDVGFRYRRVRFVPNFSWEFETGLTSTATAVDDGLLARLQGHLVFHPVPPASPVQPFLLGGLGFAHYNGLTVSDSGVLVTFGGGADFHWTPRVGFRVDLRGLSLHDVVAAGWTTSGQILFGASFSF